MQLVGPPCRGRARRRSGGAYIGLLGLAGANMAGAVARVEAHPWPFPSLRIEHDGIIACVGAHGGKDGAIAAIGTGAV